jgi:hypothetical protein
MVAYGRLVGTPQVAESRETSPRQFSPSYPVGFFFHFQMLTSSMAPPTGYNSLPTSSSSEKISYSAETPQVTEVAGVDLTRSNHCLIPWMINRSSSPGKTANTVTGLEHSGLEWISVNHSCVCGSRDLRLIHNASPIWLRPWGNYIRMEDVLESIAINDGDLVLNAAPPGIGIPIEGRYFPPGALQFLVDEHGMQVTGQSTTLPTPVRVQSSPCNGWCRKQHIYVDHGMKEKAVIYFNSHGWPVACRENTFHPGSYCVVDWSWWRFDYSRPQPDAVG